MEISREGDAVRQLYEAAIEGSAQNFNSLIQNDPLILNKISLTTFAETPLHVSALRGHLNFTKQLLIHKPKLTSELDSHNRSPLHLASAEGHVEIVQALLQENQDLCLVKDEFGRIPLHYAAMRGRVHVVELLIRARRESIFEVIPTTGETVLHLCVQYNHLEALKLLVEAVGCENKKFLNWKEEAGGNTILHSAVMLNQIESVKYLLTVPGVKAGAEDSLNHVGLKAFCLLEGLPKDLISFQIRSAFIEHFGNGISSEQQQQHQAIRSRRVKNNSTTYKRKNNNDEESAASKGRSYYYKWWDMKNWINLMQYKKGVKDKRGSIMVVATVIATMTFQSAINPPGGVWQKNVLNDTSYVTPFQSEQQFDCSVNNPCIAGTAVLARLNKGRYYQEFIIFNSISFLASVSVILLLTSGFPLENKVCLFIMTIAMCVATTSLALTFFIGMTMVTPDDHATFTFDVLSASEYITWITVLGVVCLFHTIRFLYWIIPRVRKYYMS